MIWFWNRLFDFFGWIYLLDDLRNLWNTLILSSIELNLNATFQRGFTVHLSKTFKHSKCCRQNESPRTSNLTSDVLYKVLSAVVAAHCLAGLASVDCQQLAVLRFWLFHLVSHYLHSVAIEKSYDWVGLANALQLLLQVKQH